MMISKMQHFSIVAGCFLLLCHFGYTRDVAKVRLSHEWGQAVESKVRSLPSKLAIDVTLEGENVQLNMDENLNQNESIPIYVLYTDADGQLQIRKTETQKDFTLYQDVQQGAAVEIVHKRHKNGTTSEEMVGVIHRGGKRYYLQSWKQSDKEKEYLTPPEEHNSTQDVFMDIHVGVHDDQLTPDMVDYVLPPQTEHDTEDQYVFYTQRAQKRHKRQVTQDVYVDVVALVDYGVYSTWYERSSESSDSDKQQDALNGIYQYYAFIFNGMNMMYKSITSLSYTIHIKLTAIIVSTNASSSQWTEKYREPAGDGSRDTVNTSAALLDLKDWANNTQLLPPYDHLMLFCGYDMSYTDGSKDLVGLAFLGTLCRTDGLATSVVEDLGGFQCIHTAAHELGHSMSAKHDGNGNTCDSQNNYIMATGYQNRTEDNKLNQWRFSECSAVYFNNYFTSKIDTEGGQKCLYQTYGVGNEVANVTSKMPGQIYDVDEQCRQIYGPSSYLCRGIDNGDVSNVCTAMWCYDQAISNLCYPKLAARGTTCGDRKWCIEGQCVYDSSAPPVPDNCPLGDQPGVVYKGTNCTVLIKDHSSYCYQDFFQIECCSACAAVYRPVQYCEYGDIATGCESRHCSIDDNLPLCCETCNYGDPITTTPTTPTTATTTSKTTTISTTAHTTTTTSTTPMTTTIATTTPMTTTTSTTPTTTTIATTTPTTTTTSTTTPTITAATNITTPAAGTKAVGEFCTTSLDCIENAECTLFSCVSGAGRFLGSVVVVFLAFMMSLLT